MVQHHGPAARWFGQAVAKFRHSFGGHFRLCRQCGHPVADSPEAQWGIVSTEENERMKASDDGDLDPAELASLCEALVAAWHYDAVLSAGGAVPGSQSAVDVAAVLELYPQGMPTNLEYAHEQMSGQMIDAIVLLLQSVATQLRAQPFISLGLWPLVRAEFEYAGRVAWLLEPFPEEDAGARRMARALLEQLSAMQRQRFTTGKWNSAQAKKFKNIRNGLLGIVTELFDDVHTPMEKPEQIEHWRIGGETMAPLGKAVKLFLTRNLSDGDAIYDVLSDNSHPSVISLALQSTASDNDGVTIWSYPAIPRVVNFQARLACVALYKAALTIVNYCGFPSVALEQWEAEAPAHWFGSESDSLRRGRATRS
jgi:hypothetical protein